jgi:hypothetical protein
LDVAKGRTLSEGNLLSGFSSKSIPPEDSSPDAPWKEGSERSERWKETPLKGFLPRVSFLNIHCLMLLGRMAGSGASVGRKPH